MALRDPNFAGIAEPVVRAFREFRTILTTAHINRTDNPHKVTAAQVDAVSKAGGTMMGTLIVNAASAPNYLIARASPSVSDQGAQ